MSEKIIKKRIKEIREQVEDLVVKRIKLQSQFDYTSFNGLKDQEGKWEDRQIIPWFVSFFTPASAHLTQIKALSDIIKWFGTDPFFSSFVFVKEPSSLSSSYKLKDLFNLDQLVERGRKEFKVPCYKNTILKFLKLDNIVLKKEEESNFQQQIENFKKKQEENKRRWEEIQKQWKEERERRDKQREKELKQSRQSDEIFNYSLAVDKKYTKATYVSTPNVKNVKYDPSFPQVYTYIYAIVMDGEIVYIGSTHRPIEQRLSEHIACALKEKGLDLAQQNHLYQQMRQKQYQFRILFKGSKGELNQTQLEAMECGFIQLYQPKFNWEGRAVPFRFSGKNGKVYGGYESEDG